MSENQTPIVDAEVVEDEAVVTVNWKQLGKKVAVYGGILLGGIAVGYIAAQPGLEDEDDEEPELELETPSEES